MKEIEKIIYDSYLYDKFDVLILFDDNPCTLVGMGGEELIVHVYNASDEFLKLLNTMVQIEGLFLKKYKE